MKIKEIGFIEKDNGDIIVISKTVSGVECFFEKKASGKYFIYRRDAEAIIYPEDFGYIPYKINKDLYLKQK